MDTAEFLKSSLSYLWRTPLYRTLFSTQDREITDSARRIELEEGTTKIEFTYDGIWDGPHPSQISGVLGKKSIPPRRVYRFDSATIVGHRPFVYAGGTVFAPSNLGTSTQKGKHEIQYRDLTAVHASHLRKDPDLELGFLVAGNSPEFAHWATEILTKLEYYERVEDRLDREITPVICPGKQNLSSWQRESLAKIGYSQAEYQVHDGTPLQFEELIIPSHKYLGSFSEEYPSPANLRWVRERAKNNQEAEYSERIYISRRDATRRHVKNEEEVESLLSEFGFQTYVPGELPYSKQVALFSRANIIAGPHGAGMMNSLFSENATIIELMSESRDNVHHFCLANLIGQEYDYVPARPVKRKNVEPRHYDIMVDTGSLKSVLESYT